MSALPNRILRLLHEQPLTKSAADICAHFAAYRTINLTKTITRLQRLGLVETDNQGRMQCTPAGRAAATLTKPPRWSAPRQSLARTATIAR